MTALVQYVTILVCLVVIVRYQETLLSQIEHDIKTLVVIDTLYICRFIIALVVTLRILYALYISYQAYDYYSKRDG